MEGEVQMHLLPRNQLPYWLQHAPLSVFLSHTGRTVPSLLSPASTGKMPQDTDTNPEPTVAQHKEDEPNKHCGNVDLGFS